MVDDGVSNTERLYVTFSAFNKWESQDVFIVFGFLAEPCT